MLHNIPVKISEHRTMNTSKGVISTDALDDLDVDEIKQRLNEFGQEVKEVYRVMVTKNNEKVPTKTLIITFLSPKIPDYLYVGFVRVKVRMYVPNPRRCYQCQRFGHTKNFCEHESVCDRCGQPEHESSACTNPLHCVNCEGEHPASSRDCPQWKLRKGILKYKFENDVSYPEAEKHFLKSTPEVNQNTLSYSKAVSSVSSPTKQEVGIQTDLTWPNN